ncbi:MAG: hypothetical protein Q7K65_01060 [Candidatus Buchananbacteria bacterium]|nr:hypothetical protein [Candidatus Buchananbacteria bacterium]
MKKLVINVLKFFAGVFGGLALIGLSFFTGDYIYSNFGEDGFTIYILMSAFVVCIGFLFIAAYQYTKNGLNEEKTFSQVVKIMGKNFKTNIPNLLRAIALLIVIIIAITYKDILLGILFAIIFGVSSAIGYIFSNVLVLLLVIIAVTLIGIYNKLK